MPTTNRTRRWAAASASALFVILASCTPPAPPVPPAEPFDYVIDPSIVPNQETLLGPGGERPVVAMRDAEGRQYDFIATEVVVLPTGQAQLDAFLARRGGTIVTDREEFGAERTVVVSLDPSSFPLDQLVADAERAGIPGLHRFSSESAARLMALVLRERAGGLRIASDGLHVPHQSVLLSAIDRGPVNAFSQDYFAGPSGARAVQAWQYAAGYRVAGPLRRVRVAIIDGGFFLNADGTTIPDPANGARDLPTTPLQYDYVTDSPVIRGANAARCSGDTACPWHGHGSASVATGTLGNGAYAAGTGGLVADAILLNVDLSTSQVKAAIDRARGWDAEVINMSFGGSCGFWCKLERDAAGYYLAFGRAIAADIFLVASAGNSGVDALEEDVYPCALPHTLCVGALGSVDASDNHVYDDMARDFSNYGPVVDLFAPTEIWAWYGTGAMPALAWFGGTSASAPFVSGVVATMRSVAPGLGVQAIFDILEDTARTDSPDPKVARILDAFAAVRAATDLRQPNDRFEPNDSAAAARTLTPGTHADLTIGRANDADFFRTTVAGPTSATITLTYPGAIGTMSLPPFGRETTQACGRIEQMAYAHAANGLTATYRLAAGSFVYAATSPGNPLPYTMDLSLGGVTIAADAHEPNNTLGTSRNVGDGGYIEGTLHGLSDVDFYTVYSQGSFSTIVLSMHSRARVESSDIPLTLQLYDASGTLLGTSTSSADCATQASLALPQGFYRVRVSGGGIGAYRLWLGSYGQQHPIVDVDAWFYLILNPDVPVTLLIREPEEWFVLNHNSDFDLRSLTLEGAGLHMTLFDEAGTQVLGEGVATQDLQGQTVDVSLGQGGLGTYLLRVQRTEVALPGAELPLIPATLMSSD